MVVGDEIKMRPMMYLALSYDHRVVDGREAVSFLVASRSASRRPSACSSKSERRSSSQSRPMIGTIGARTSVSSDHPEQRQGSVRRTLASRAGVRDAGDKPPGIAASARDLLAAGGR